MTSPSIPARARVVGAVVDRAFVGVAAILLVSMLVAALHDASQAYDVWYYHLPFAARLARVVPPGVFVFHARDTALFDGFPLLAELLQGLLWRVTGRPECANLVAFATVPLLAWFLSRRFRVPPHLAVLALLAVPLIQLHATSCYIDLPANAAASVLVLLTIDVYAKPVAVDPKTIGGVLLASALAVNMKFQLHPLVLVLGVALGIRMLPRLVRDARGKGVDPAEPRARARRMLAVIIVALPAVFATPLKNAVVHHNPYYPERLMILGAELPGVEDPYADCPPWLADAPRPARFAISLLEIGIRPLTSTRRWTVDQWMPEASTGNRMGGFFNAYVVANLAILAWRIARDRSREARTAGIAFGALTVFTSVLPQSHELRYYLYWMIVLVSLNLWLACREGAVSLLIGRRGFAIVATLALGAVLVVTECGYVYPSGSSAADVARRVVSEAALAKVHDGDRICVIDEPWNFLWAATFHPPRRYEVKEATRPEECGDYRLVE